MKKTSYHHGNLRSELIRVAIKIVAKEGQAGLRLREVAAAAGVSHAALYRHFKNKEDLLASIAQDGFVRLVGRVERYQEQAGSSPRRQYLESGRAYVDFALEHPEQFRIMFSAPLRDKKKYPDLEQAARASFGQLVAIVHDCREKGIIPAHRDKHVPVLAAWSLLHGLANLLIEGQFEGYDDPRKIRTLTHSLLRLLVKK